MAKLYYIVQSEMLTGGVIEAQVIASLRAQCRVVGQPKTKLIFLEPARIAFGKHARSTLKAFRQMWPEGDMTIIPYISRFGNASAGKSLAAFLIKERLSRSDVIFHCRGPHATSSAHIARLAIGRGRVIYDVRGAGPYEVIHRLGFPWKADLPPSVERAYSLSLESEKLAASLADYLFVVSPGLKSYAAEILGAPERRIIVVPSCVADLNFNSAVREKVRRHWGVNGAPVFIYSGRLGNERVPQHLFRVFSSILRFKADAKLVILSYLNQLQNLSELLANANIPNSNVIIADHPRDEVLTRLCAADVGVLFLEDALRFKDIASPIKIPEYLSAGLPLLLNSMVGKIPELVQDRGLGWIIDQDTSEQYLMDHARRIVSELEDKQDALRSQALNACSELFLWRHYIPAIRQAYGVTNS